LATTYDITFLRLAMRGTETLEKGSALQCLKVIDEQNQQGRIVTALEVSVKLGYLEEDAARYVDEQARAELIAQQSGLEIHVVPDGRMVPPTRIGAVDEPEFYDLGVNGEGLDDFELGPKLGRGPVGASYLGRRKSNGAQCVVKVISRRFQSHPDILNRVTDHLRGWEQVSHGHVAEILALGLSNDRDVVVYEMAPGRSLTAHLERHGPLSASKALRVVYELALALAAAEVKGLVCGDIRADKVYFDKQHCMLVDVGLSRASSLANGWGQIGLAFGHPAYLAPEVLQEQLTSPTFQTDIYALGILLYEMLCGQLPFEGEPTEMLNQHFDAPLPPPPGDISFSTTIAAMVLKMTAKLPSQRIRSASELVEAINRLLKVRRRRRKILATQRSGRPRTSRRLQPSDRRGSASSTLSRRETPGAFRSRRSTTEASACARSSGAAR
jgi:serine/threonine protein kinase